MTAKTITPPAAFFIHVIRTYLCLHIQPQRGSCVERGGTGICLTLYLHSTKIRDILLEKSVYMHVSVFNGQQRIGEVQERLGYDPKLISSHCNKGLLNFHTEPALLHDVQFREQTLAPCTWFIHCTADSKMKMQQLSRLLSKGQREKCKQRNKITGFDILRFHPKKRRRGG